MQICVLHGGNRSVLSCWDVDRRPMRSCYLTPFLFKYLVKTPYYREILNRNIELEMWFYCWWVLSDCAIRETADQCRKLYEKHFSPLIFTFYLNRGTSVLELFPVVVFQLKNDFQWGPCRPIYRQPKPSPDYGRKIQNKSNNVHIDTYSCKPELIPWR